MTQGEVNAFDRAGFWRVADITLDAAFAGKTLDEATDQGEAFRHLGYWSDGRPVLRPDRRRRPRRHPPRLPPGGIKVFGWTPLRDATITKAAVAQSEKR